MDSLTTGINELKRSLPAEQRSAVDSIAVFLAHSPRDVAANLVEEEVVAPRHRGVRGYEVELEGEVLSASPLHMLVSNANALDVITQAALEAGLDPDGLSEEADYRVLDGEQIVVSLEDRPRARLMERGNDYIDIILINADNVRHAAGLATDWLINHVGQDGELSYGYQPASRERVPGNNLIRQWMASIALGRATALSYDLGLWSVAERNLRFNLATYYHLEGDLGVVYRRRNEIKLGAVALAALALREAAGSSYSEQEDALNRTITSLWNDTGAFQTFLRPPGRTGAENFYPGEALLYWATRYVRKPDPELLSRIMTSFAYYRDWHRENPNPAFIGWHTQAYYTLWQVTGDDALRDFIFEMNDSLLVVQQWNVPNQYRDTMGRFYVPHGYFGPPHASSTGVYLEGLVDAFSLARAVGDEARAESYRVAILRGLRSVLQLQFQDKTDMFYVPEGFRKYVRGGIRTTVYDSTIRVDNVQHNLMAMQKILRAFGPEDYDYPADAN